MCYKGKNKDEDCSPYVNGPEMMCKHGYGCFEGKCRRWFSVDGGITVEDSWLCKSMSIDPFTSVCAVSDIHEFE